MTEILKDITFEIREIQSDIKSVKKFGIILSTILTLIALWMWKKEEPWLVEAAIAAGVSFGISLILPQFFIPFYYSLTMVSIVIGYFVSRILLSLIFFLTMAPVGIFARIFKKDLLNQKFDKNATSYWIKKDRNKDPQSYERLS